MKTKTIIGFLVLIALFTGCRKDFDNLVTTSERYADGGDGDLDLLGYGYNIQGEYASSTSATRRVIDVRKMRQSRPSKINVNATNRNFFEMRSGSNFNEYNRSYAQSYGASASGKIFGLKLFEAELKTKFSGSSTESSTYSFATVDMIIERKILTIYNDDQVDIIENFLDDEFKADCQNLTAANLLNKYGAGVLRKIKVGGKLTANYQSQVNAGSSNKKSDVEAGVKLGFKSLFNVDVDVSTSSSSGHAYNNSDQLMKYQSVGGGGHSIMGQSTLGSPASININNWSSSVTNDNSVLIGFFEDTFIPIYQLIPNLQKAREVRKLVYQSFGNTGFHKNSHNFELPGDIVFLTDLNPDDVYYYYYKLRVRNNRLITLGSNIMPASNPSIPFYVNLANAHVYNPSTNQYGQFTSAFLQENLLLLGGDGGTYQLSANADTRALSLELNFLRSKSHPAEMWQFYLEATGNYDQVIGVPSAWLVKDITTNKYYLQAHGILYPFYTDASVDDYGFHRARAVNINGTGGYQIGEAI